MEFIKPGINIDFIGKRKIAYSLSSAMIVITIILLVLRGGPNYGVDFSGGIVIQVKLEIKQNLSDIKAALRYIQLEDTIIQEFEEEDESEFLIRLRKSDIELVGLSERVKEALKSQFNEDVDLRRVEMVGPQVGENLRQQALLALFIMGGGVIHDFAFAFMIGIVTGTYSTVYVASPILLLWERNAQKKPL